MDNLAHAIIFKPASVFEHSACNLFTNTPALTASSTLLSTLSIQIYCINLLSILDRTFCHITSLSILQQSLSKQIWNLIQQTQYSSLHDFFCVRVRILDDQATALNRVKLVLHGFCRTGYKGVCRSI